MKNLEQILKKLVKAEEIVENLGENGDPEVTQALELMSEIRTMILEDLPSLEK